SSSFPRSPYTTLFRSYLFEEHGFHGVTVNTIVEKVGTSKGGFYHHFKSKDELLYVIHDTFITFALKEAMMANETYKSSTFDLKRSDEHTSELQSRFEL